MSLSKEDEKPQKAEFDKLVRLFGMTSCLTVASGAMLFSVRPAVARPLFKDPASLGLFLTRLASGGALVEFLTNPFFGKLADCFGRKAVLPIANVAVMVCRSILFFNSKKKWPIVLEQLVTIPIITSYFTAYRSALSDKLSGEDVAKANALIGAWIGLAVIAGPLAAELVMRNTDPKYCYLVSVLFAGTSFGILTTQVEETLPVSNRKPMVFGDIQPFSFLQLLKDRTLNRLMFVIGLQSLTEGRSIYDVLSLYMKEDLGWEWNKINRFVGFNGMGLVVGGLAAKPMIGKLGMRSFTFLANVCNSLNHMAWGGLPPFNAMGSFVMMIVGSILSWPGMRKRDCAEALLMTIGAQQGFGNGLIQGAMNNFRAIVNIIGPLLFGTLYAAGRKRNLPGLPFYLAAVSSMIAMVPMSMLTDKDLGLDENGRMIKASPTAPEPQKESVSASKSD
jgi:MFS family permease